ncbi:hypothetical protein [Motiliproteus sp. SC1-56]|uniref:hypothetical protein n=1 Tax=Motiliproteus sp. SC1-56 TaxID=2799565 RepID=UPI001F5D3E18|nr:hypothetical protein [Motiliproteus sp. SC1-56]
MLTGLALLGSAFGLGQSGVAQAAECTAANTVTANVVAFDTLMIHNRLGAQNPNWMMYALRRDVVEGVGNQNPVLGGAPSPTAGLPEAAGGVLSPGNVSLRPDKRPRPIALRVAVGQCLKVNFQNLLAQNANPFNAFQDALLINDQVKTRFVGVHVAGMSLADNIASDASFVGQNANSAVAPGGTATYTYYAEKEGSFVLSNPSAAIGGEATGGNNSIGLFGVVTVQPPEASFYRSQVYEEEMRLAADADLDGLVDATTAQGHPVIDYEALYPNQEPWISEGKANLPILNMQCNQAAAATGACVLNELVHSEINAIIVGPNADGSFPDSTYPLESVGLRNPTVPNRLEPFREFASIWHDEGAAAQAFEGFFKHPVVGHTLHGVRDSFMINYGSGGIGAEIIANRLGVGPMYDCLGCAYEEFFLSAFTVGDVAVLVDTPANVGLEQVTPEQVAAQDPALLPFIGPKATTALYQDDPANVHNSYTGDFIKFRNVHAGPKEQHVFHLHNHQWLFNANDDRSNYLDAQGIGPGSTYTYEIAFGGSGNRNKTAGDAIFHCHFYPHFAQGMWYMWRIHDVTETGTVLAASVAGGARYHTAPFALGSSQPALQADVNAAGLQNVSLTGLDPLSTRTRAHPDGEILAGVPITATVPMPGKPMAPMPEADVVVITKNVDPGKDNDPLTLGIQDLPDSSQSHVLRPTDGSPVGNPGYPFWVAGVECNGDPVNCDAGVVGQRAPTPPLDMLTQAEANDLLTNDPFYQGLAAADPLFSTAFVNAAGGYNGGLPRHSIDGCKAAASADPAAAVFSCTAAPALHDVGNLFVSAETRIDFHKEVLKAKGVIYPEEGTDLEKAAMGFHAQRNHATTALNLDGTQAAGTFVLNGLPPVPGAPFQDPCVSDSGQALVGGQPADFYDAQGFFPGPIPAGRAWDEPFVYAAANIQIDAVFNKAGYHYPQQRIIALWGDVMPTINKEKAPEPFVMRLNSFNCAKFQHSNLVPKEFEVDDYQVRTPTDIIGQHIHLPKWDLTTADGAGNGWNYEDGTLSPGMVRERIEAINHFNDEAAPGTPHLVAGPHPALGAGVGGEWNGGRVTLQRWFADPIVDRDANDRGLGIVFTHDHYGPSTHQQVGLYATLLAEPADSTWLHNETGEVLGARQANCGEPSLACDGGPTSWQAVIIPDGFSAAQGEVAHREFYMEFSDFQHAYEAGVYVGAGPDGRPFTGGAGAPSHDALGVNVAFPVTADSFRNAINPSFRQATGSIFPDLVRYPPVCPGGAPRPCPEAISADDVGMLVTNYRNEPVALRVYDPDKIGPDGNSGAQADGLGGDLAFALQSREDRACAQMNRQPQAGEVAQPCTAIFPTGTLLDTTFPPPINDPAALKPGDPFTPMMRAFDGDVVKVKIQTGGHEHEHSATIHGVKWVQGNSGFGPDRLASGWRNAQTAGISEQYTFFAPLSAETTQRRNIADYAYSVDASQDGWWSGMWGVMRSYRVRGANQQVPGDEQATVLTALPNNDPNENPLIANRGTFTGVCPNDAPVRVYDITAVLANDVLGNALGATITGGLPDGADQFHVGGPLDADGGTLVYNPRNTVIPAGQSAGGVILPQREGPLHDPTAIMYVHTDDLVPLRGPDRPTRRRETNIPVRLRDGAPVEPVVIRANAGDCLEVTLRNRLREVMPDLAGYNTLLQMVVRDRARLDQGVLNQVTFNNNLVRPSGYAGLHAQMVEYDVLIADGQPVGANEHNQAAQLAAPGESITYQWYAGDIQDVPLDGNNARRVNRVFTPVEFGASNLIPADKVKQGQKGMIGALIVEPQGAVWDDSLSSLQQVPNRQSGGVATNTELANRGTRADLTVNGPEGTFEDLVTMVHKGINHRFKSGEAVPNIAGEGVGIPEDSHDSAQKGINYGSEPAWFRFGIHPTQGFGNAGAPNTLGSVDAELMFSNALTAGADPWTPVFDVAAGTEARVRLLDPTGVGRGTVYDLHGHVWARDPYLPEGGAGCLLSAGGLGDGRTPLAGGGTGCGLSSVKIGANPLSIFLGGQESVVPSGHYDIVLPSAGGVNAVSGDYLYRDHGSFGVTDGIWGILRVDPQPQ